MLVQISILILALFASNVQAVVVAKQGIQPAVPGQTIRLSDFFAIDPSLAVHPPFSHMRHVAVDGRRGIFWEALGGEYDFLNGWTVYKSRSPLEVATIMISDSIPYNSLTIPGGGHQYESTGWTQFNRHDWQIPVDGRFSYSTVEKAAVYAAVVAPQTISSVQTFPSSQDRAAAVQRVESAISPALNQGTSRGIGLINRTVTTASDFGASFLDGVRAIWTSINDPNPLTRGLWNENTRKLMRQIEEWERGFHSDKVILPHSQSGNTHNFSTEVKSGEPIYLDPETASGFVYSTATGGTRFSSFMLPLVSIKQTSYDVDIFVDGHWTDFVDAAPNVEYHFNGPVDLFRVSGIEHGLGEQWVSMVSFSEDGNFIGSITAVPEPGAFGLFFGGALFLGLWSRFSKPKRDQRLAHALAARS